MDASVVGAGFKPAPTNQTATNHQHSPLPSWVLCTTRCRRSQETVSLSSSRLHRPLDSRLRGNDSSCAKVPSWERARVRGNRGQRGSQPNDHHPLSREPFSLPLAGGD